ncbi:hypothetical protein Mapa_008974 [Marchantia paleacea]|nr:hypothetical protein Mapa_008974 [Marchantia paleacea]
MRPTLSCNKFKTNKFHISTSIQNNNWMLDSWMQGTTVCSVDRRITGIVANHSSS